MNFTLSYLAAQRLGELAGLTPSAIAPMKGLSPIIAEMQEKLEPELLAQLNDLLLGQGLIVQEGDALHVKPEILPFLRAIFAPEKCLRTRLKEPEGCSDTYYVPVNGAWARLDAVRGQLSVTLPLPEAAVHLALRADVEATLQTPHLRLLAERREGSVTHSALLLADEKGYEFLGAVTDGQTMKNYAHAFAKTEENRVWLWEMLAGKREFSLPESEQPEKAEKPSAKKAARGFLIALAVNVCVAVVVAVLKAVL